MSANGVSDPQELQSSPESNSQTKSDTETPQPSKNLNEIIRMAQKKGDKVRSSSTSIDNFAKFAWQKSTNIRQQIKKGLNTAYSVATGLTNPEVRKEIKKYINNIQPPNSKK